MQAKSLSWLRRNFVEPLYYAKSGSPRLTYWQELGKSQFLPQNVLLDRQWRRLRRMLSYAYKHNRFYKQRFDEAGVRPEEIKKPEDMRKIPLLIKEEIRLRTQEMISEGYDICKLLKFKTGGSTGKPLEIYLTEKCSEMRNACARRHDRWTGWEVGEPIGAVWGNPELPRNLKDKVRNWLLTPTIYLDTMSVCENSVKLFAQEWEKLKPTLLFGHAHSLFILAQYVRNFSIITIRPKGILSTSMMLLPNERKMIEVVFGVELFDRYGCEEVSLIASECEKHEGLHLNIEHLFIEFIKDDGSEAAPGEPGKIIVTDLMNKAMPFIRYSVEDVGVPTKMKCSCGRGLPLMEKISGRVADFLIKKDGTKVAGISLIENTLTKIPGIDQMQVVQESLNLININLVPGRRFSSETKIALINYFKNLFGRNTDVKVAIVKKIKPEKSGKYRFSICKFC